MSLIKELRKKISKKNDDLIRDLKENGIENNRILYSIRKVPRELFVDDNLFDLVYRNIPLPISCNQTISQPFVVAYMIDCLELKKADKVLEVGTGTGYQTALLAHLCKHVYTIEIFSKLYDQAKLNHKKLELKNVSYMLGNALNGWKNNVLFDAIIISAATKFIPIKLLKSLKKSGKLIFPKRFAMGNQKLILIKKINERFFDEKKLFDVKFVPLLKNI